MGKPSIRSIEEFFESVIAKPDSIELPGCEPIPILYEDRSVLALDKPRGWMLAPASWQKTLRNLQAAIESSIAARDFWARSRGLKFLRYVHRLDADTSGVLLFAKSPGAVKTYSDLFESRRMEKTYLAVVIGEPKQTGWTCRLKLAPDPKQVGRMKVDSRCGKPAETHFRVLQSLSESDATLAALSDFGVRRHVGALESGDVSPHSTCGLRLRGDQAATAAQARISASAELRRDKRSPRQFSLIECKPITGRTHQIRVHLAESGLPIVGDELYGKLPLTRPPATLSPSDGEREKLMGLRAVRLAYVDPFTKKRVDIHAPAGRFLKEFGF